MAMIVDQYGQPIDTGKLQEPQTSSIATLKSNFLVPMTDGLTPTRLANILRAADNGDLLSQHRLFADMEERDAHLSAEIGKRKLALMGLDWSIVPPRNATPTELAHTEWLTEVLTDAVDPIEDLMLALMDGVGHGFSPVELEWRREGKELLPAFHPRPQEWFRLDRTHREIRLRDSGADGAPLTPFGWVFHTHGKAKTGYIGRMGLHRVLVWPFLYKTYAIGDFAEFLETFGLPIIVGKYFRGASNEEKASLMQAVTAVGHDARGIMPADMQLEIEKVAGGEKSPHLAMVDWADRAQSKAILGQTMSAEAKASGLGSGNANLHKEVRHDILVADARQIAGTITRDLLYPMAALNRGGIDGLRRCPRLVFDTGEPEDIQQYAKALPELVGVGMRVPVSWAHEKLRIPEAADGEAMLAVASPKNVLRPELRPEPGQQTPATGMPPAALAALSTTAEIAETGGQAAIDGALDAIPPEVLQAQMAEMIGGLLDDLAAAGGYEKAMTVLAGRYPGLSAKKLESLLARAMFAAEVWGNGNA